MQNSEAHHKEASRPTFEFNSNVIRTVPQNVSPRGQSPVNDSRSTRPGMMPENIAAGSVDDDVPCTAPQNSTPLRSASEGTWRSDMFSMIGRLVDLDQGSPEEHRRGVEVSAPIALYAATVATAKTIIPTRPVLRNRYDRNVAM